MLDHEPLAVATPTSPTRSLDEDVYRTRVHLYVKVLFGLNALFVATSIAVAALGLDPTAGPGDLMASNLLAVALVAVLGGVWLWLARGRPSRRALVLIESLGTVAIILDYAYLIWLGPDPLGRFFMLPLAGFALTLRAALVPSPAGRTIWVGTAGVAIAVVTVLGIAVAPEADVILAAGADRIEGIWTTTLGVGFIVVTVVTSSVIYGLRKAVHSAKRLGQYEITRKLGEGGMGVVFQADHVLLQRPTAIKVLRPELAGQETIDRFEREVRQTSRLEHPNSVYIYDYGRTSDGQFYYAMEYLDGVDLDELVRASGPLPDGRVVLILRQAAEALAEAHAMGLVHRDIKPANIMLCDRGGVPDTVKVLDFGLVKSSDRRDAGLTRADTILGTPHYLAPEAMRGAADIAAPADIYALGASAYFLLSGRPMFEGDSAVEICSLHLTEDPPPLAERVGRPIEPALEAIIGRCVTKKPETRFADGAALAEALAELGPLDWSRAAARRWWDDADSLVPTVGDDAMASESQLDIDLDARG
ncbi:MAG: serine/threonine protein kinase [Gemmatimonadetes bacterium]|nr:serine/threonine protein kinase [Gemmatimonadota bacterium]